MITGSRSAETGGGHSSPGSKAAISTASDRIYVLSDGQVIQQGGHANLLVLGGQYAELYSLQASQYSL
jgi:hypothetical protein